ncbi:MAG: hypothetical protein MUO67_04280, partial [Anaerolineales bacterium]|nr:hypothetical protein [Anaerolineales bacterium]
MSSEIDVLSESLIDELVTALGLPKTRFYHALFWRLFRRVTDSLAKIGVPFDQITRDEGLPAASSWCLDQFCEGIRVVGKENVPAEGPLMVTSNHPGAYDGLVLFTEVGRKDMTWVSSEIPFLDALPNLREH